MFNKYLEHCKYKSHMTYDEYQTFLSITAANFKSSSSSSSYDDWQNQHDFTNNIISPEYEYVTIDFSMNSIADLIHIVDSYVVKENTRYNINLNMLHLIKAELRELDAMVGMKSFKKNVLDQLLYYIQGFHVGVQDYKHTVIYGPPGTGKTEIAKILGNIYSKLGVIQKQADGGSNLHPFKKATRSDLIAGYVGQTAIKIKSLITSCLGGVLFIDEAYSLGDDSFSKECVDTLCESLSDQKDRLMVIIAGYENELNDRFFSLNVGLESRFVWRFKIDSYTHAELWEIFTKKIGECDWKIADEINGVEWFKKHYNSFSAFGRDVESFIFKVKIAHSRRVYGSQNKRTISLKDLNLGFEMFLDNKKKTSTYVSNMFL